MADTASLIQAYLNQVQSANNPANINMVQSDPGNYLQNNFMQLPAYQLLYGQNATSLNPVERFKQDPGYQYQQDQAAKQLQRSFANRGLLDSGPMASALQNQSQQMANAGYQQYLGQQNALFSDYQNRLANLSQMGAANTGSQNQMGLGGALNANYNQGGGYNLTTGGNISNLFGNQGVYGGNAMVNTAAAQSNNLFQGAALQAQIDAANQASRNQGMSSLFGGLGSMLGSGGAFGAGGAFSGLFGRNK